MSDACPGLPPPALLALAAAFLFALGVQLARLGMRHIDPRTATLITIATAALLYWLASPLYLRLEYWRSPALLLFAAIGLFRPVLSGNLGMAGTYRLGPTISSTVAGVSPLFGVAFGALLLGERASSAMLAGTVAIVAGVMILSWRGEVRRDWPLWALGLPLGAALLRTLAQGLAKIGMEVLPDPFFVGLVGYTVSLLVAVAAHARSARRGALAGPGSGWLVATGLAYGTAILSLNTALGCGAMVTVAPIVATAPLFTLLLGLSVFRERQISVRVALAVVLVCAGVILVSA